MTFASPDPRLRVTRDGPVATVAIDNPAKRNAFDLAMWRATPTIFAALAQEADLRVIVLRGAGDQAFCSGADIGEFATVRASAAGGRAYEAANVAAFDAVARCPTPTVAAIRGFCMGGGVGLALACDLRLAGEGARFAIPAARLGVGYPPEGMARVVAAVGAQAAKDLFFTARQIDAEEARALGLVGRVVAEAAFEAQLAALVENVAAGAPLTLRAAKAAIDEAAGLAAPSDAPTRLAAACFDSADYAEGVAAFLARRPPRFTGR